MRNVCYNREFAITEFVITEFDCTVKLGYNKLGYSELLVITNKFCPFFWYQINDHYINQLGSNKFRL
jgi:hypothetical protein